MGTSGVWEDFWPIDNDCWRTKCALLFVWTAKFTVICPALRKSRRKTPATRRTRVSPRVRGFLVFAFE